MSLSAFPHALPSACVEVGISPNTFYYLVPPSLGTTKTWNHHHLLLASPQPSQHP